MPVILFISVSNARDRLSVEGIGQNMLRCLNLLRPTFNHGHAAIKNELGVRHGWILHAALSAD